MLHVIQPQALMRAACPRCRSVGKIVPTQTVKALAAISLRHIVSDPYYFCESPNCPVVYFTAAGAEIRAAELRERVYQKEPDADDVPICYCFQHRAGAVRHATTEDRAQIIADIQAGIQANQCACDLRNPQGSCCLGNVRSLTKKLAHIEL